MSVLNLLLVVLSSLAVVTSVLGVISAARSVPEDKVQRSREQIQELLAAAQEAPAPPHDLTLPSLEESGAEEATSILDAYLRDLVQEAGRIARRVGAHQPTSTHVREAAARIGILRSRSGVAADLLLAVGTLLLGAAGAYQVNIWTGSDPQAGTGIYVALALAGGTGFFVAAAILKWQRR